MYCVEIYTYNVMYVRTSAYNMWVSDHTLCVMPAQRHVYTSVCILLCMYYCIIIYVLPVVTHLHPLVQRSTLIYLT